MATAYAVKIDLRAVGRFATSDEIMDALEDSGILDDIVAEMRRLAPDDPDTTRSGANSIDFEIDDDGTFFRISWDKEHFYMYFPEVGTEDAAPRPFMRPVADRYK